MACPNPNTVCACRPGRLPLPRPSASACMACLPPPPASVVVDDPRQLCSHWHTLVSTHAHAPIWEVRHGSKNNALSFAPAWPTRCDEWDGQCDAGRRLRYCRITVHDATVLDSGLVLNGTHRFPFGRSYIHLAEHWRRDLQAPQYAAPARRYPRLYSFRMLWAAHPFHALVHALPLLSLVLDAVRSDNLATVLAPGPMFRLLAQQVLSPERVVLVHGAVAAEQAHLVVGHPPFSPLMHQYPRGCLARMRPPPILATGPGSQAQQPSLLFLPRLQRHSSDRNANPSVRRARAGVRTLGNLEAVLKASTELARRAGLRLQTHEFTRLSAQRRAFQRARVVVGAHGGAWSGLAFAQPHVSIIEWSYLRDAWSIAEYLLLNATYYQLMPRWRFDPGVPDCNASGSMDDCPWDADLHAYRALLRFVLDAPIAPAGTRAAAVPVRRPTPPGEALPPLRVRSQREARQAIKSAKIE